MAAEKNFENKVKRYLDDYGCWWLKYWGGAAYTKKGIPDILCCSDGMFLGIDVKAPNGKPSYYSCIICKKSERLAVMGFYYIQRILKSSESSMNTKNRIMLGISKI